MRKLCVARPSLESLVLNVNEEAVISAPEFAGDQMSASSWSSKPVFKSGTEGHNICT